MSKRGINAVHLRAVRRGCPAPVYRQKTTRISRVDPAIMEKQRREQEQAQRKLEELFSSANLKIA